MTYTYARTAAAPVRMTRPEITEINAALRRVGFDGNGRFRTVGHAHTAAGKVLDNFGYEFTDMLDSYLTMRGAGTMSLAISRSNPENSFAPVEVDNTALHFSYTKLGESNVEVVAYLG